MSGSVSSPVGGDHPITADAAAPTTVHTAAPAGPGAAGPGAAAATAFVSGGVVARSAWSVWDDAPLDGDYVPDDLVYPTDPELPGGPRLVSQQDQLDAELDELLGRNRYSRVDELEWQEWDGVEQDA
ncbi:hypothetical protein, partial [Kribbella sindirgiensis]